MDSETASSVDELVVVGVASVGPDTRGRHRILAELKRVEQEIKFYQVFNLAYPLDLGNLTTLMMRSNGLQIEEELEELEKTDNVSTVCEELLRNVETIPDPLLSETNGPLNPIWDRWFEGPQESQGCQCWIL